MTTPNAPSVLHVLVIGPECEDCDPKAADPAERDCGGHVYKDVRLDCPYPSDRRPLPCATWEPCGCALPPPVNELGDYPDEVYDVQECPSTGLEHRYFGEVNELLAPTGACWPAGHDDLHDVVSDMGLTPGRYPVHFQCEDECYLVLELAKEVQPA